MSQQQDHGAKRVFLTGATGSMGLAATRELLAAGHEVVGVTRSSEGARALLDLGATPVEVDLFDLEAVREAMRGCDVVAHFATSVPTGNAVTKARSWQMNDRLRIEGTSNLIAAAEAAGVRRFVFESIALAYPDRGEQWIDEDTALEPVSPRRQSALDAEAMLAAFAERGGEVVVLRFGGLYGPGRASEAFIEGVRAGRTPLIGGGNNFVSSIHVDDVGTAVAAAMTVDAGTYNIVDDEPMTQHNLMSAIAAALDAPAPIARVVDGKAARVLTVSQRVSNRRFRDATGWAPRHPNAAGGWAALGSAAVPIEAPA